MTWDYAWPELKIHLPASRLVCQKNVRKHKAALVVNRNVTEMYANCGSQNVRCSVSKVEIISLVLRSAIKTRDQTHQVLKNAFAAS